MKIIELAKSGEQLSLDVKIGTIIIEKDNKLYFSNFKDKTMLPNVTIDQDRGFRLPLSVSRTNGGPKSTFSASSNYTTIRSVKTPMTV